MRPEPAAYLEWRPELGEVLEFMSRMWAMDHALNRASKRTAGILGITAPQRLVIRIVGRFPGLPAGRLARLLHVHASTLTGVLQRLERKGLIRRRTDPRDRRRSLLALTSRGRSLDVPTEGTVEAAIERLLATMPPGKLQAAREVLAAIAGELERPRTEPQGARARTLGGDG